MKLTVEKVIRELEKKHGWENLDNDCEELGNDKWFVKELIKDTIKIINDELIKHKNISIKK